MFNKLIIIIVNCLSKIGKTHGLSSRKIIEKIVNCTKNKEVKKNI